MPGDLDIWREVLQEQGRAAVERGSLRDQAETLRRDLAREEAARREAVAAILAQADRDRQERQDEDRRTRDDIQGIRLELVKLGLIWTLAVAIVGALIGLGWRAVVGSPSAARSAEPPALADVDARP